MNSTFYSYSSRNKYSNALYNHIVSVIGDDMLIQNKVGSRHLAQSLLDGLYSACFFIVDLTPDITKKGRRRVVHDNSHVMYEAGVIQVLSNQPSKPHVFFMAHESSYHLLKIFNLFINANEIHFYNDTHFTLDEREVCIPGNGTALEDLLSEIKSSFDDCFKIRHNICYACDNAIRLPREPVCELCKGKFNRICYRMFGYNDGDYMSMLWPSMRFDSDGDNESFSHSSRHPLNTIYANITRINEEDFNTNEKCQIMVAIVKDFGHGSPSIWDFNKKLCLWWLRTTTSQTPHEKLFTTIYCFISLLKSPDDPEMATELVKLINNEEYNQKLLETLTYSIHRARDYGKLYPSLYTFVKENITHMDVECFCVRLLGIPPLDDDDLYYLFDFSNHIHRILLPSPYEGDNNPGDWKSRECGQVPYSMIRELGFIPDVDIKLSLV